MKNSSKIQKFESIFICRRQRRSSAFLWGTEKFIGYSRLDIIFLDGENIHIFTKYYNDLGRYDYADVVYYNQRYSNLINNPSLMNSLSWLTCSFGVKPWHTIFSSIMIILLFFIRYTNPISLGEKGFILECISG